MRVTLLLHYAEPASGELSPEAMEEGRRAFGACVEALVAAGVLISAEMFQPSVSARTVTTAGGVLEVRDGSPRPDGEQVGGTFVLEVPDLDAAVQWAGRIPSASWGCVEIRATALRVVDGAWQGPAE